MRIAIIQPRTSYHIAGSEKISLKHAEYLSLLGHTVDFYTSIPKDIEETFLFKEFIEKKFKSVNILRFDISDSVHGLYEQKPDTDHMRWVTESLAFNEKIFDGLKKNYPDIILSYYLPDCLFKPCTIPNVIYLSGYPSKKIPWYKSFIKFCDGAISISSIVTQKWSSELQEIPLIYSLGTGVDYPLVKQTLIEPKAKYNIVFAGRLIERKGIMTLLDAFEQILKSKNNIHLWILGDGELHNEVEKKIIDFKIKKSVSVVGLVQNPYDYFKMADICVFPSHQGDGLMGTVLESMAAGKPVITTINNGNEDVITSGVNGILIEPQNSSALADTILDLIENDDLRLNLGQKAQEFIAQNVVWEKNASRLCEILEDIIKNTRKNKQNQNHNSNPTP